jgi:HD-GYP domain-containing protein (c-di-GMP phosphodiesterase class II)
MKESEILLSKIASLRQRLEQAQGLARDAGATAAALLDEKGPLLELQRQVEASSRQEAMLDHGLAALPIRAAAGDGAALPSKLTARAARLLRRAHDLLGQLRANTEDALMPVDQSEPLAQLHRETLSMTDAVLRTVQAFPEAPSAQVRLCEGLEAVLNIVAERLGVLSTALARRRKETVRRQALAEALTALAAGQPVELGTFEAIAESVRSDVLQGKPLAFPERIFENLPEQIAAQSLIVAEVIARITRHELEWRKRPLEPIVASLVHDVGMLQVPVEIMREKGPLTADQRRQLEAHAILGGEMTARIVPAESWLVEAASQHHERLDGTGYPAGLRDLQIKPLIRFLGICDMYAALCQPRSHRGAQIPRTALADTMLAADKGGLDPVAAERLLLLSFYPAGSVVELSDGSTAIVAATHQGRRDLNTPARPVVAVLAEANGQLLLSPRHLDLNEVDGTSILRVLPPAERRERLGRRYPLVA